MVDHGIWSNIRVWKQCIELNVKKKITESNDRQKFREKKNETQNPKSKKILGMGLGKIKNLMTSKESKFNEEILVHTNLIFNELSRYVQFLCNFGVPFEKANNLLIFLSNFYQMDKNKMHILLTELMSNQKKRASMFSEKEMLYWSLMKRGERFKKFGHSNIVTILGLTIKFIDNDKTLR